MLKKFICAIALFGLLVCFSLPASATSIDLLDDYVDDEYSVEAVGDIVYPAWADFQDMIAVLPTNYTVDGYTYNFDAYAVYLAYSATNSDGSFKVEVALWDSSAFAVYGSAYGSGYHNLTATDLLALSRKGLIRYLWDADNNEWVYSTYSTASRSDKAKWLYLSEDLYANDGETVYLSAGVYSAYDAYLVDDPDYSSGDLPIEDTSTGGFTAAEKATLFEWLEKIWTEIVNGFNSLSGNIGSYFESLGNMLAEKLDTLIQLFEMADESGETTGRNFWDMITSVFDTVFGGFFDTVSNLASDVTDFFSNFTTNVTSLLESVFSDFFETVQSISDDITSFFETFFTELFNTIENVVQYLFVPPSGYFDGKVNEFKEQVPFVGVVTDFTGELFGYFERQGYSDAPVITVDLSAAEGKYNYGFGSVTVLDLSWYDRYKPFVDMFLSTILWITYLWLLYKRLPDIIYGAGAITESAAQFSGVNVEGQTKMYRREYRRSHHK